MLQWLDRKLKGYLLVELKGYSPERFLNLCKANHILIWGLSPREEGYVFYMRKPDFQKTRALMKKSKTRLRIREKHGLPFALHRHRRRKLSVAALLLALFLVYALSFFIWDIGFEGNQVYSRETLLTFLNQEGVYHGIWKDRIRCDELEQKIRNEFPDITWVSAEISGTRLLIRLKENEGLMTIPETVSQPGDLVAQKAGTIVQIVTRAGIPQVKAGDTVEMGQVLVSGAVPILNDSKETVGWQMVQSDADIWAETEETVQISSALFREERTYTGRVKKGFFVCLGPWRFQLFGKGFSGAESETVIKEGQLKLLDSFYLPVRYGVIEEREYTSFQRNLSEEEARQDAESKLQKLTVSYEEAEAELLSEEIRWSWDGIQCHGTGVIRLKERLGIFRNSEVPQEAE